MRSNLKLIGATVLFTLSILLSPSLAGASSASPSNGNPTSDQVAPWNSGGPCFEDGSMIAAACNLSPALEAKYPDTFGGITVSDNDSMINVYMTSMPVGLQSFVDSIAPSDAVTYVPCSNTIRAIWNVQLRIEAADLQLAASGIDLVGFGANVADNSVDVDVYHLTAAQKSQLDQEFGAGLITVQESSPGGNLAIGGEVTTRRTVGAELGTPDLAVIGIGAFAVLLGISALLWRRQHRHMA
jgi:hypothetical protein